MCVCKVSNIISLDCPEFELESAGPAGDYHGEDLGRFELLLGEEEEGCPVYEQAHSREIRSQKLLLLYRWEKEPPFLPPSSMTIHHTLPHHQV